GRLLGPTTLGLYSLAYTFVRTPANHLVVTLQNVLFSASARAQDNQAGLQRAYLTVVSAISLVVIPVFAGVAAVPYTVIDGIFGHKWLAAAQVLMPLSLAMILHAIMAVTGPVLSGKGAASAEFKVQFWVALALIASLLIAARYSVVAVAWAVCGVYALRLVGMVITLVHHVQLPALAFLRALRGGVIVGAPVVSVLLLADMNLTGLAPLARLLLEIFLAAATYLLTIRVFQRQVIVAELRAVLLSWAGHSGLVKRGCRLMGLGV
ncbi:MAG: oligosaccharide flippase family protein, partial [Thiobacillus sp.]|nr:oligosaccharide flippase family protein [Thiobacillus sp.]